MKIKPNSITYFLLVVRHGNINIPLFGIVDFDLVELHPTDVLEGVYLVLHLGL